MKIYWAAVLVLLAALQTSTVAAKSFEEVPASQRSGGTATQDKAPKQWLVDAVKGCRLYCVTRRPFGQG